MKWAEPNNDLMVFNVDSLIRVGSYGVLCFKVIRVWLKLKTLCKFCHLYATHVVILQMFLGHMHYSRKSILFCFASNMFSFVVGFVPKL